MSPELQELVDRRLAVAKRRTNNGRDAGPYIARATRAGVADHQLFCQCEACLKFWGEKVP